jgi:zinc transporter
MIEAAMPVKAARLLDGRGGARTLDAAGLQSWSSEHGVLWVDMDLNDDRSRNWVRKDAMLERTAADSLLADETRPRAVSGASGLLVVLRGVNLNPGADPEDMVAVRVWLDDRRVITSHRRHMLSVQDIADELEAGTGPTSTGSFLVFLVAKLTDRIGRVVDEIEDETDAIELAIPAGNIAELRGQLSDLRRQIASLRRFLAPQRDSLDRLYRQPGAFLTDIESHELREETDRLTRHLEDLDLTRDRALVTQEEMLNRVAGEQNQRMYLLSVVAAIFLPLSFLTGLLGMNVAGLPGTEVWSGFAASASTMIVIGIGLVLFFRWKKWI